MVTWESIIGVINDISPALNLAATLILGAATLILAKYTKLLYSATSDQERHIKKQTKIMGDQLKVIEQQNDNYKLQTAIMGDQLEAIASQTQNFEKQTKIMNSQAGYAEKQTEIMDKQVNFLEEQGLLMEEEAMYKAEDRKYLMLDRKYRRLQDEMDKLVEPLYIHASIYNEKEPGYFGSFNQAARETLVGKGYGDKFEFWDGIRRNLFISRSENLAKFIELHFKYMDKTRHGGNNEDQRRFEKNIGMLIDEIKKHRERLKAELDDIKKELGM